jgi:hypothetical protein
MYERGSWKLDPVYEEAAEAKRAMVGKAKNDEVRGMGRYGRVRWDKKRSKEKEGVVWGKGPVSSCPWRRSASLQGR